MKILKKFFLFYLILIIILIITFYYIWQTRKNKLGYKIINNGNIIQDYKFLENNPQMYYSEKLKMNLEIPKVWAIKELKNCTFSFNAWDQDCLLISNGKYTITIVKFNDNNLPESKEILTKEEYQKITKIFLDDRTKLLRNNIPIRLNEQFPDYSTVILDLCDMNQYGYIVSQIIERNRYKYLILYSTPADEVGTEYKFRFSPYIKSMDKIISSISFVE